MRDRPGEFLALPPSSPELAGQPIASDGITDPVERQFAALLTALGFAADAEAVEDVARRTWEFHDALFHKASRSYGDWRVRGGSYRFQNDMAPPPAFRPAYHGETITLPPAGHANLKRSEALASVMEQRRSVREFVSRPVGLPELSDVLHRVARVRSDVARGKEGQDCFRRPVPSGGSIHEIELYLAVRDGNSLEPGLYHYRGDIHALTRITDAEAGAQEMLAHCAKSWRQEQAPPVLVVLATRFPRIAWKYEGVAYHLTLVNAGVLLQSLYLVTADLGLGGCAAGLGDNAAFQRATGNGRFQEVNIGEFAFGWPA